MNQDDIDTIAGLLGIDWDSDCVTWSEERDSETGWCRVEPMNSDGESLGVAVKEATGEDWAVES